MKKESFAAIQDVTPASVSHGGDSVSDGASKRSKDIRRRACACLRVHLDGT